MKKNFIGTLILIALLAISYPLAAADQKRDVAQEEDKRAREKEQQKMDTALIKAVYYGNTTQGIISLLEKKANPNALRITDEHNRRIETPIIRFAVRHAHKNPTILR